MSVQDFRTDAHPIKVLHAATGPLSTREVARRSAALSGSSKEYAHVAASLEGGERRGEARRVGETPADCYEQRWQAVIA